MYFVTTFTIFYIYFYYTFAYFYDKDCKTYDYFHKINRKDKSFFKLKVTVAKVLLKNSRTVFHQKILIQFIDSKYQNKRNLLFSASVFHFYEHTMCIKSWGKILIEFINFALSNII